MICLLSLCLFLNVLSPYKSIYIMSIYMIYVVWQEREVYEEHIAALWGRQPRSHGPAEVDCGAGAAQNGERPGRRMQ